MEKNYKECWYMSIFGSKEEVIYSMLENEPLKKREKTAMRKWQQKKSGMRIHKVVYESNVWSGWRHLNISHRGAAGVPTTFNYFPTVEKPTVQRPPLDGGWTISSPALGLNSRLENFSEILNIHREQFQRKVIFKPPHSTVSGIFQKVI